MKFIKLFIPAFIFTVGLVPAAFAQANGSVVGQVQDTFGAAVVGASITVVAADGKEKTATSDQRGEFSVAGLAPGTFTVKVKATNFALYENTEVQVAAGQRTELTVPLTVETVSEQVDVSESNSVSTDPNNNASATVLKEEELNALPDDPEELEAALQALAGASAGPNGGQIYIDGFTGGRLPPKEAIREIRINNNPFSAEYDRPGFGRIEILTKPGADRFRGSAFGNFNDESLNSRNPFSQNRAPSQTRFFGGNVSGPIVKGKSSFFVDISKRDNDSNAVVNATILGPDLNVIPFQQEFQVPNKRFSIGPRFDYAINDNNTLVVRYDFDQSSTENQGIGGTTLPSRASESDRWEHEIRVTETMIVNPTTVNETRVELDWEKSSRFGDNSIPAVSVSEGFSGGGATVGDNFTRENSFEIQNYTTTSLGNNGEHSFKFGVRLRRINITDRSENGFGGSFSFSGVCLVENAQGICIERLPGIDQFIGRVEGKTDAEYFPTRYSVTVGNPEQSVSRTDYSLFATNDWRISPTLMLSAGLRYENQTNINDNTNFAPRFAVAWSPTPTGTSNSQRPYFVLRGAFGVFYDRFSENNTLDALRFNGIEQLDLVVDQDTPEGLALLSQPVFTYDGGVTNVPTTDEILAAIPQSNVIRRISPDLRVPVTYQGAISIEKQLPGNTRASLTYVRSQTNNVLRQVNINAPFCSDLSVPCDPEDRPFTDLGSVYQRESTGTMRMNRINFNMNTRLTQGFSLGGNYSLGFSENDSDGGFPVYSYGDFDSEWGRAGWDTRHSFNIFGSFQVPWGISLSTFLNYNSGRAFNITTGRDDNLDNQFNERPTFGELADACAENNLTYSYCDVSGHDPNSIIPRNWGRAPQFFNLSMQIGKNFGFGKGEGGGSGADPAVGGGNRGGRGGFGGGGGPRMVMMGGRGPGGFFGGGDRKPYNLNLSLRVNNLLNTVNYGAPVGNIASSRFGDYVSTGGGFGGFGGFGGGSANRRIELQARFSW